MDNPALVAILGVQDLLARYAHLFDRRDVEGWAALFSEDALFSFGELELRGRPAIRAWLQERVSGPAGLHSIFNLTVSSQGPDQATAEANWLLYRPATDGSGWHAAAAGSYQDVLVRQDGRWLFQDHRITAR